MQWLKAALVGALGSLVMFLIMMFGIHVTGVAPFQMPPSAAFLTRLGLNVGPLPLLMHFGYGAFWSVVLVFLFRDRADVLRGLGLSVVLWLFMMVALSPLIGWGLFGMANTAELPARLQLESGIRYLVLTLMLHLIYGAIIGWLNPVWISASRLKSSPSPAEVASG